MSRGLTALGLASALLLAGCGQTKVPEEHYYRLVTGPISSASARLDGNLVVQRFVADGLLGQRPLAYGAAGAPHDLRQYNYHFWADVPPRMLQELTVEAMREAGVAAQVVTPEQRVLPDYELTGKIKRLELLHGAPNRVAVRIELAVNRARDGELVWLEDLSAEEPVADGSVAAATRAMGTALGRILGAAVGGLSASGEL